MADVLDNLRMEDGQLTDEMVPEPIGGGICKDHPDRHIDVGSPGSGFFISPLRQMRSRAELERAWKDSD